MGKIAVYCEIDNANNGLSDVSFELLSKARQMKFDAKKIDCEGNDFEVVAIAIGKTLDMESAKKAFSAGADYFTLIKDDCLELFSQTAYSLAFIEYFSANPCDIIIFPATSKGRIIAPRITTILDTGLVADCTGLELIERNGKIVLASTRPTFGAELMATIISKKNPQCATVRPKTFAADFWDIENSVSNSYFEYQLKYPINETRSRLLRTFLDKDSISDFAGAKIILAGGFGLYDGKNREYYDKLEKLAKKIGAKFGATRKVVDLNLVPKNCQIGQTGTTVLPELYVAFGISGAVQHMVGAKNSKKIIAINSDKDAEIFKYADYKIVADAKKIIDDLIEYISK